MHSFSSRARMNCFLLYQKSPIHHSCVLLLIFCTHTGSIFRQILLSSSTAGKIPTQRHTLIFFMYTFCRFWKRVSVSGTCTINNVWDYEEIFPFRFPHVCVLLVSLFWDFLKSQVACTCLLHNHSQP